MRIVLSIVPWRMRWRIGLLLLCSLAASLLDMAAVAMMLPLTQMLTNGGEIPTWVQKYVVPIVGSQERSTLLLGIALAVGLAFLVKNAALIGIRWWSLGITQTATSAAQARLLEMYLAADYSAHRRRKRARVLETITGAVPSAFGAILLGYISLAVDGISIALLLGTLLAMAPEASLVAALIFGGVAVLTSRLLKPWATRFGVGGLYLSVEAWAQLNPAIEGFRETRIFRKESYFSEGYRKNRERFARLAQAQGILGELPKYLFEVVMIAGIILVAILLFLTREESTAFGLLAVFAAAAMRIIPALNRVVATLNGVRSGGPALDLAAGQIRELESEPGRMDPGEMARSLPPAPFEDIVVRHVGYRYPDGREDILQNVDVVIPRGRTIALVGSSGAGKSTFADLLTGLIAPTSGSITVGSLDIAKEPRRWMQEVAVVSQKVYLWDASIRDLITFGQAPEDVDRELLDDVIERARLSTLIAGLPDGLDSHVGDGGTRLSGGQAQRLGIARALYARPKVLILDEATSALDNQTEHEITQTIEGLHGEITVIVIAHRLSTVKNADEILFFSGGRLADRGTMSQLRTSNAEFARLVELGSLT